MGRLNGVPLTTIVNGLLGAKLLITMRKTIADLANPVGRWRADICEEDLARLMPAIDRVLYDARMTIPEVEGLAVSIGPGSFTGLRIGLSTVKGLALATGKPVVGVPTLHALAWSLPYCRYPVCSILDARKQEVYCALFEYQGSNLVCLMEETALDPATDGAAPV